MFTLLLSSFGLIGWVAVLMILGFSTVLALALFLLLVIPNSIALFRCDVWSVVLAASLIC